MIEILVWVEVAGVRVYSSYFSSNDLFEVFKIQIPPLKKTSARLLGRPS